MRRGEKSPPSVPKGREGVTNLLDERRIISRQRISQPFIGPMRRVLFFFRRACLIFHELAKAFRRRQRFRPCKFQFLAILWREFAQSRKDASQIGYIDGTSLVRRNGIREPFIGGSVPVHSFGDSGRCPSIRSLRNGMCTCFGLPDVTEPPVNLGLFLAELPQALFIFHALALGAIFVPFLILAENAANARFKRTAFFNSAA